MTQQKTLETVSREDIENAFRLYDEGRRPRSNRPKSGDGSQPGTKQYVRNPNNPDERYPAKMLFRLICLAEVEANPEDYAFDLYVEKMGMYKDMEAKLKKLGFEVVPIE